MGVDAVHLVVQHEYIVIDAILEGSTVGLLPHASREYARSNVLRDLADCGRMYDLEVDIQTSGVIGESAGFLAKSGTIEQVDSSVEAGLRHHNHLHIDVHSDVVVHVVVAVQHHTGDASLQIAVQSRRYEQDAALVGNLGLIECDSCGVDGGNSGRAGRNSGLNLLASRGVGEQLGGGVGVDFQ